MNSKLFAICVILMVASVISLTQANAIDQIDNVVSVNHDGHSETQHIVRQRRDVLCEEGKCTLECISKGNLLGGKCTLWFFCSCN